MLDPLIRNRTMYSLVPDNSFIMNIKALERESPKGHIGRPIVRAATILKKDSSTEIIDVKDLAQRSNSFIQCVELADSNGRLYCVNGLINSSCWLKIVTIAKDCQSSNVILMTTDKGVVLKTIRIIAPGEPLLMWFTENILAMMNISPHLQLDNFYGNGYMCHLCKNSFEYPNALKIHLALKCNRLDLSYLWTMLAREFSATPTPPLTLNLAPPVTTFKFELSGSLKTSPTEIYPSEVSPIKAYPIKMSPSIAETLNNSANINSPTHSSQGSPVSETERSPTILELTHIPRNLTNHHSAFKPYINQPVVYPALTKSAESVMTPYRVQAPPPTLSSNDHAAQIETIYSNMGKSKQGHRCVYCGKIYSRKYGLKIHIRTHTGYKPLQCKYCLRPFGDPSNLNKHVRLHAEGDTPYRCDVCGKVLVRRRDLDRHIRSRHQDMDHMSDDSSDVDI